MRDGQKISESCQVDLFEVAASMRKVGLPDRFIADAVEVGRQYQGVYDLMMMWAESESEEERGELVADIQDMIDECADLVPAEEVRRIRFDDLESIAEDVMTFKNNLLLTVEERMTLTELAEKTGMPLASLSRFFNSASMPRKATLLKIGKALGLGAVEIECEWSY